MHASGRAVEQTHSELKLELPYRLRQSRLREMQPFGCPPKVQLFGQGQERLEVAAVDDRVRLERHSCKRQVRQHCAGSADSNSSGAQLAG